MTIVRTYFEMNPDRSPALDANGDWIVRGFAIVNDDQTVTPISFEQLRTLGSPKGAQRPETDSGQPIRHDRSPCIHPS
jgi:hypothetical protein